MAQATHVDSSMQAGVLVATIKAAHVAQYEAGVIGEQLEREAPDASWRIAIDLAQVELLASAGLGMLVSLGNQARAHKGRIMIANVSQPVMHVLKMTRLDKIVPIADSVDAAIKKLA